MTASALLSRLMDNSSRCLNNSGVLSQGNGSSIKAKVAVVVFDTTVLMDSCIGKDTANIMESNATCRATGNNATASTAKMSTCQDQRLCVLGRCADSALEYNTEMDVISLTETEVNSLTDTDTRIVPRPLVTKTARKRPCPFDGQTGQSPAKWIGLVEDKTADKINADVCIARVGASPYSNFRHHQSVSQFSSQNGIVFLKTNENKAHENNFSITSTENQRTSHYPIAVGNCQTAFNRAFFRQSNHKDKNCKLSPNTEIRRESERNPSESFKPDSLTELSIDSPIPYRSNGDKVLAASGQTCRRRGKSWSEHWMKLKTTIPGFMTELNSDMTVTCVSENVLDFLGFNHDDVIGQSMSSFLHPSYLPILDYVRDKASCHKGGPQPLDSCQPIPIQLKHGQGKNPGYRTFNWHVGVMRSAESYAWDGDSETVIISVCIPVQSSSSSSSSSLSSPSSLPSLLPSNIEWMLRPPGPQHWALYCMDDNTWALCPRSIDLSKIEFEMMSVHGTIAVSTPRKHPSDELNCLTFKTCQPEKVLAFLWDSSPWVGFLVGRTFDGTSAICNCGKRLKNNKDMRNLSKRNTVVIRTLESVHNNNYPYHSSLQKWLRCRNMSEWSAVCLQKTPPLCCVRELTKVKGRVLDTDQEMDNDENHTHLPSIPACKSTHKSNLIIQKVASSESSVSCAIDYPFTRAENSPSLFLYENLTNVSKTKHPLQEEVEIMCGHQSPSLLITQSSEERGIVNGLLETAHETMNSPAVSTPCQSSPPHPCRTSQQLTGSDIDGRELSILCTPDDEDENHSDSSSNVSEGFCVSGLEQIDLTTEFSFHKGTGDVIMPVARELDCAGDDFVLNDSPTSSVGMDCTGSNAKGQCVEDPFSHQTSNDFTYYSLDYEPQPEEFQSFDHILDFPAPSISPSSSLTSHTSFSINVCNANSSSNLKSSGRPNEVLVGMDTVVTENKNPFEKESPSFHHSLTTLLQSCDKPLKQTQNENRKSLLRSLLNKNEERSSTLSHSRQHSKFSRRFSESESYLKLKHTTQTKELPVPQSHTYKKRRLTTPIPTQELPLPGSVLKNAFNSTVRPFNQSKTSDVCKSDMTLLLRDDDFLPNLTQHGNDSPSLQANPITGYDNDCALDTISDALPDDLIDLAMEYCNSLDVDKAETLMEDLNDHFEWLDNPDTANGISLMDSLNQTAYSLEVGPKLQQFNTNGRFGLSNSNRHTSVAGQSATSVCLPLSTATIANTQKESPSVSIKPNSWSAHKQMNKTDHISLLRQAVTSPNVDKLIEKIPLGRKCLYEKFKSFGQGRPRHADMSTVNPSNEPVDISLQNTPLNQNSRHPHNIGIERPTAYQPSQSRKCVSNFNTNNRSEKTTAAVSHISISVPLHSPKRSNFSRSHASPIKLKIPAPSDASSRHKSQATKSNSMLASSNSTKPTSCPNSSSEGVSVMVMRKENHRSRKSKTVATQTDHRPDEIYPALELSHSDVIITPSVYCDLPLSSQSPVHSVKSPTTSTTSGNKTTSYNCNAFSSSLRSLVSPRDSKEVMTTPSPSPSQASPSPSTSSSSSLSELELHLRGWSGPDINLSSPLSSETSEASPEVPFLQRFLTGELSKDKYEKLDKGLLEKQKSPCGMYRF